MLPSPPRPARSKSCWQRLPHPRLRNNADNRRMARRIYPGFLDRRTRYRMATQESPFPAFCILWRERNRHWPCTRMTIFSLDCVEIAEELEGTARSDEHALESFLERLLKHLLKWRYEPHRQSASWRVSIQNSRSNIQNRLADSPSLRPRLPTLIARAYEKARRSAGVEMKLDQRVWDEKSPSSCPWSVAQLLSDFWPDPVNGLER